MWVLTILFVSLTIFFIVIISQEKNNLEFFSPVESGFEQFKQNYFNYPIKFFFFATFFLILDIEFIILIPAISTEDYETDNKISFIFIMIIWFILILEIKNNQTRWEE